MTHQGTLTGIRPSLWARCPTAAVFQGRGEEEAEPAPEAAEYWRRGRWFEAMVVSALKEKHGADNIETQVDVPIPGIGTGHIDAVVTSERLAVEIASTTSPYPNGNTFAMKVRQLQRYVRYSDDVDTGAVVMVDPNRFKPEDVYPVIVTDEEVRLIDAERDYIVEGVAGGELDEHGTDYRPCERPSQARERFCPFAAVCFADWQEPEPNVVTSPEALDAAARIHRLNAEAVEHKQALKEIDEETRGAKSALRYFCPEKGESVVGPYRVKTWPVRGSRSISYQALAAAGIDPEPFTTRGDDRVSLRVSKADTPGDVDFGEAPF